MRLIILKDLTVFPRNGFHAILLGCESDTIPYRYHVVIPRDPAVFSLTQDKIVFLEDLKGFTLAENIQNIKDHGSANMVNSWEEMRISPEPSGALGSRNPRAKKIPAQYLSGVQTSDDVIEYQFLACFDEESSRRMRSSLLVDGRRMICLCAMLGHRFMTWTAAWVVWLLAIFSMPNKSR